jgi:methylmalonyl-CoA/ethylmalonyl-CoA epimerase
MPAEAVSSIRPVVTGLAQISCIVRDAKATMQRYVEVAGIGPWAVYEFGPPEVTNVLLHGKPATFKALICLAWTGDVMWELIQPLEGESIYQEFLDEHGDGMHHTLVRHAGHNLDEVVAEFKTKGCEVIMSFERNGTRFAYIDAMRDMKMVLEVFERPPAQGQTTGTPANPPLYWYPHPPAKA